MTLYQFDSDDFENLSIWKLLFCIILVLICYTYLMTNMHYLYYMNHNIQHSNCTAESCFWMCHFLND